MPRKKELDTYLMGDQPATCPKCGRRTEFVDLPRGRQKHTCPGCRYKFILEDETWGMKRNPPGIRPYGPGKFNSIIDSYVYELFNEGWGDEELGDAQDFGWYAKATGENGFLLDHDAIPRIAREHKDKLTDEERRKLDDTDGVIISEDSNGFVTVEYFQLKSHVWRVWKQIQKDAEKFYEGVED